MKLKRKIKISNLILFVYFGLGLLFLSSFLFRSKKIEGIKETIIQLPAFNFIKVTSGSHIKIVSGKENQIGFYCKKNDYNSNDFWKINGDTLVVFKFPKYAKNRNFEYRVSVKNITGIEAFDGNCTLCFSGDSIKLSGFKHSSFNFERPFKFEKIRLRLKNSSFSSGDQFTNKMDIVMTDSSTLHFRGGKELLILSDTTSQILNW